MSSRGERVMSTGPWSKPDAEGTADEFARSTAPSALAQQLDSDDLRGVDAEMVRRAAVLGKPDAVTRAHRAVRRELERRGAKGRGGR
ncbi:hypothetical protein BJF78_32700 [Pseudonocardia sp. CNS-139]|nr:hypothetical protein BJF78_32700 [Pseudonocardia sp. CNS-139]